MSKICTIRFNHPKTQKGIEITGEFSDPEWKTCLSFVEYADDLSRTQLVRKGNARLVIQWNAQTGFEPPVLPPISELSEFLHVIRPFILNKESTYYIKVNSIISKNFQYDYTREILKRKRDLFLGRVQKNLYQLSTEAIVLSSEEMLKKWLNAYEYHRDESKREELQELHSDGFPLEITKFFWIDIFLDKAVAIFWLQALIRKRVGRRSLATFGIFTFCCSGWEVQGRTVVQQPHTPSTQAKEGKTHGTVDSDRSPGCYCSCERKIYGRFQPG